MLIHLEKLGKTFGEKVVLHDVTALSLIHI